MCEITLNCRTIFFFFSTLIGLMKIKCAAIPQLFSMLSVNIAVVHGNRTAEIVLLLMKDSCNFTKNFHQFRVPCFVYAQMLRQVVTMQTDWQLDIQDFFKHFALGSLPQGDFNCLLTPVQLNHYFISLYLTYSPKKYLET